MTGLVADGVEFEYEPDSLAIWLPVRGSKCGKCGNLGPGSKSAVYTVDLRLSNGRYVELKGKLGPTDRTRLKALYEAWGDKFPKPLSLLLQRDNWLTKAHKRRYSDWCRGVGFDTHVGDRIPDEWTK